MMVNMESSKSSGTRQNDMTTLHCMPDVPSGTKKEGKLQRMLNVATLQFVCNMTFMLLQNVASWSNINSRVAC